MKNTNNIKNFKNIKKNILINKRSQLKALKILDSQGYKNFIKRVKNKKQSDDETMENLELSYLNAGI